MGRMKVLVLGGTRFFGKHMVSKLLEAGHDVTVATRGRAADPFGDKVRRLTVERTDGESLGKALAGQWYGAVCDSLAYCSNDVKALLDHVECGRYVMTSTASVYDDWHMGTEEREFDPLENELIWCGRDAFPYHLIKRQAECALFQAYPQVKAAAVRYPFVVGPDDYTGRLAFYVQHFAEEKPLFIDHPQAQIALVRSDEAGAFLAFLAEQEFTGPVNGCSPQTISMAEVAAYVWQKLGRGETGWERLIDKAGEPAPYNGTEGYTLDTRRAQGLGFAFTPLREWIYGLLDTYLAPYWEKGRTELCR